MSSCFSNEFVIYSHLIFAAYFTLARDLSETRRSRPIRRGARGSSARSHGDALLKPHPVPVHPRSMLSRERSTICSHRLVRLSVRLSVQEIGFGDFVQIAVHVLSLACGNAPVAATRHTGTKTDTRLFCFCPQSYRATLHPPALFPSIFVASCAFSPSRNSFAKRDRSATDRERPEIKRLPRRSCWRNSARIDRTEPLQCPSPFHEGCPTRR